MGHHHEQDHHSHHHGPDAHELSFAQKAAKLVEHWIAHNEDHAGNYRRWANEFRQHQLTEAAALLESAAELTRQINQILDQASQFIPTNGV
ncbi:MAG: hypothetical protein M0036_18630 [Desulfobacteraceae bacterium]|nr:hypothetical protein [Desulfobacteraceae bacterium]